MAVHVDDLRRRHSKITFTSVTWALSGSSLTARMSYVLSPDIPFVTTYVFPVNPLAVAERDQALLQAWLVRIGIIDMLSYWKLAVPPEIEIAAGYVHPAEIPFFDTLLHQGMSEFFFINDLDGWQSDFVHWHVSAPPSSWQPASAPRTQRILLPIGGGKDSLVSAEIVRTLPLPVTLLSLNEKPATTKVRERLLFSDCMHLTRSLDPSILSLMSQGYLNGHTPFSAMLALVSTFAAWLHDSEYIVLSNEWSANEGNTTFHGHDINHQYSKSVQFERDAQSYISTYLSKTGQYFSLLRPLHELQIAKIFSLFPEYFPVFLSCNRGSKSGVWCGDCPKCLFAGLMLAPFVSLTSLQQIFGQDLFATRRLQPVLDELTGMTPVKSLECVGTREESLAALALVAEKYAPADLPPLLSYGCTFILGTQTYSVDKAHALLHAFQTQHAIPQPFLQALKQTLEYANTI